MNRILEELSTAKNDSTEESNKNVARQCIDNPELIYEIAEGFNSKNKKIVSDCIEVFTIIAENNSELIIPFADKIVILLTSKETKTRWEATHTLSFIADKIPNLISSCLNILEVIIETDKSTIVRDYSVDIISNYSKAGKEFSEVAFKILVKVLNLWGEKHAKQALKGLNNVMFYCNEKENEIKEIAKPYLESTKKVVVKEAKKIMDR